MASQASALTLTGVAPASGPIGQVVTVTGSQFSTAKGATRIKFGNTDGNNTTCANTTSCTTTVPSGTGRVAVTVVVGGTTVGGSNFDYAPSVTKLSPATGSILGGTVVGIDGTNFVAGGTTIRFGAAVAANVTCSSSRCTATAPPGTPGGTANVTATVTVAGNPLTSPAAPANLYTYTIPAGQPVITALSPATGPATGGTVVTITGVNFSVTNGATAIRFGGVAPAGVPATAVSCTTTTSCKATSPAGVGTVDVFATVAGVNSVIGAGDKFTYIPPPTITSVAPNSAIIPGNVPVVLTGTGFSTTATTVKFAAGATVLSTALVACTSTTSCTVTPPANTTAGPVNVTVAVNGQASAPAIFTYNAVPVPVISSISPAKGFTTGGNVVTITGINLTGATSVTFGGAAAAAFACDTDTHCTATSPASPLAAPATGVVQVIVTTAIGGPSSPGPQSAFTYALQVTSPPAGPNGNHQILVFPQRDFVTTANFEAANAPYSVEVRRNGIVVGRVAGLTPLADGTMDVNHPGANCWAGTSAFPNGDPGSALYVTPDVAYGDVVRVTDRYGFAEETTTANVANGPALDEGAVVPATAPVTYNVRVHGTAANAAGTQLPIGELEQRMVVTDPKARFLSTNKRTLRAVAVPVPGSGDGTISYDNPGTPADTRWTATYVLEVDDRNLALTSESRILWLGAGAPAAANEGTIYEVSSLVIAGPQPPCNAPLEPDLTAPTSPTNALAAVLAAPDLDSVHVSWGPATDNRAVTAYVVSRDGTPIATLPATATSYDDLHLAPNVYSYSIVARDAAGNTSVPAPTGNVTTVAALTSDLAISISHTPAGDLQVGNNATYRITVTNLGSFASSGPVTVTDTLPAGLTLVSAGDAGGTGSPFTCNVAGATVTCVSNASISLGSGGNKSIDITVTAAIGAYPEVTNSATVTNASETTPSNNTASDYSLVNLPAVAAANVFNPPQANPHHTVIAFPARDFVHGDGFALTDKINVEIWRNGQVIASARGLDPVPDDTATPPNSTGLVEINHPGGGCWGGDPQHLTGNPNAPFPFTPNLQPGDKVRYIVVSASGQVTAQENTIANVKVTRGENPAPGVIVVHGSAQDQNGLPLAVSTFEQRIIAGHGVGLFEFNGGRRALRAGGVAGGDGILTYDAPGSINWTATYSGLSDNDVATALDSSYRAQYLGTDPIALTDLTIFENDDLVAKGPSAPCTSPADTVTPINGTPDLAIASSHAGNFQVTQTGGTTTGGGTYTITVTNNGTAASSDPVSIIDDLPTGLTFASSGSGAANYGCFATNQRITCNRNLGATPLAAGASETITINVNASSTAVGTVTNQVEVSGAFDSNVLNNRSGDATTVDPAVVVAPDITVTSSHVDAGTSPFVRTFTVGLNELYTITVTNSPTAGPTTGPITVTDTLPAGMTFVSSSDPSCAGGATVTCTLAGPIAPGASVTLTLTVAVAGPVNGGTVTNTVAVSTVGEANTTDDTSADPTLVNPAISAPGANPTSDPTGTRDIHIFAFPSRDYVHVDGFTQQEGNVTVAVRRNGNVVGTVTATPIDDPTTPIWDGILDINHPPAAGAVNVCFNATPDVRPGDEILATDAQGRGFHIFVADVRTLGAVVITPATGTNNDGVVEVHGVAQAAGGGQVPLANLQHRFIRPNGQPGFSAGKNPSGRDLRAGAGGTDGTLAYDSANSTAWTATYSGLNATDITTLTTSGIAPGPASVESRAMYFNDPVALNDLTIYEFGTGVAGGAAGGVCPVNVLPNADLGIAMTSVVNGDGTETLTVTVTNSGPSNSTGGTLNLVLPTGVTANAATVTPFPAVNGGLSVQTVYVLTRNTGGPGESVLAWVVGNEDDLGATDPAFPGSFNFSGFGLTI